MKGEDGEEDKDIAKRRKKEHHRDDQGRGLSAFRNRHSSFILCLMHISRLRGRKICERVQRQGALWKGRTMIIRWMEGHPRHPSYNRAIPAVHIGTLASSRLHKSAVKRNRMRRRCREAFRLILKDTAASPTLQLLISPRSSSLHSPFADILGDAQAFFRFIHARRPHTPQ